MFVQPSAGPAKKGKAAAAGKPKKASDSKEAAENELAVSVSALSRLGRVSREVVWAPGRTMSSPAWTRASTPVLPTALLTQTCCPPPAGGVRRAGRRRSAGVLSAAAGLC